MTNLRCFQTERVCGQQFQTIRRCKWNTVFQFSKWVETLWIKEKLLMMSNFSFSHSVFKWLVLQIHKNQCLFGNEQTSFFSTIVNPKLFQGQMFKPDLFRQLQI